MGAGAGVDYESLLGGVGVQAVGEAPATRATAALT